LREFSDRQARSSFAHFFHDTPWLNIPPERLANFSEPMIPRGGLLGGASGPPKVSKLQQLALARKKKAEEQKSDPKDEDITGTARRIGQLSVGQQDTLRENTRPLDSVSYVSSEPASDARASSSGGLMAARKRKTSDLSQAARPPLSKSALETETPKPSAAEPPSMPATPSSFAQTLLGSRSTESNSAQRAAYPLPYMAYTPSVVDVFAVPSPDDVVLNAQSKGSLSGAKKAKR
jgi:elongation factor 1 alpha-like protein